MGYARAALAIRRVTSEIGAKRTWPIWAGMSRFDPNRTYDPNYDSGVEEFRIASLGGKLGGLCYRGLNSGGGFSGWFLCTTEIPKGSHGEAERHAPILSRGRDQYYAQLPGHH
jgi:hypothetical protein